MPGPSTTFPGVIATVPVGLLPDGVATNPGTNRIYSANTNSNTVSVLNGTTNQVITTIAQHVGTVPFGIAVNPKTNRIYVTNFTVPGTLKVIDGAQNTVIATVTVDEMPLSVAVNPSTNRIYVANQIGTVSVVDGQTNRVMTTIPVTASLLAGIAVNPQTNLIYVARLINGQVTVIDGNTNQIKTTITLGCTVRDCPFGVAVDPQRNRIFVTNLQGDSLLVIDGATNQLLAPITVGSGQGGVAVNLVTSRLYVARSLGPHGQVVVIDESTTTIIARITIGAVEAASQNLVVQPRTNWVYVCNTDDATVSVIQDDPHPKQ